MVIKLDVLKIVKRPTTPLPAPDKLFGDMIADAQSVCGS